MNIEEYIKNRHRNNEVVVNNKKIIYLKFLITRVLLSIILIISISIFIKIDDKNILLIEKYIFEDSLKFTKINNWYKSNVGEILPSMNDNTSLVFSSSDIKNSEYETYQNGVKIMVNKGQVVSTFNGGIVVFIGEKENYGNTLILQGNDGIDYWYGGIENLSVNLYDYLEKDTLIGETSNSYLYLVLQKNGEFISYDSIL